MLLQRLRGGGAATRKDDATTKRMRASAALGAHVLGGGCLGLGGRFAAFGWNSSSLEREQGG
jgi:hypothetical protein